MWFDNLTPEEIKERLQKEGVFTPLLEQLGLSKNAKSEEDSALTPQEERELVVEAVEELLLPKLWSISTPPVVKEISLKYIPADKGNGALEFLAAAKHSIYTTHFTPAVFSKRYVALQRQKVDEGLIFERLVYKHRNHSYEWLEEFLHENGTPINRYREYEIEHSPLFLRRDFMVIDAKWVLFWFKNPQHAETFIFCECKEIAEFFLNIWKVLTPKEGQESKKTEFLVSRQR
jgi:hypothetical protein